jgi:mono/diheme cytochrome c family protein
MIVSFGFLGTGIFLLTQLPHTPFPATMYIKIGLVLLSIPLAVIGYKKKNKVLATLSFFLIVVSFSLAYKAKAEKAGTKTLAINLKDIFNDKCSLCHGTDGKLGMSGAKDLSITQLNHAGILEIIANGKNAMAPYKEVLSVEQIEAVASYIETDLKGK